MGIAQGGSISIISDRAYNVLRMKERFHSHERLLHSYTYLLLILCFLLSSQTCEDTPLPTPFISRDWDGAFRDLAAEYSQFPNQAIQDAMHQIKSFSHGEAITWEECPQIKTYVNLKPMLLFNSSFMSITDETAITAVSENGAMTISATWSISGLLWDFWKDQRPENMWHELFHLKQMCLLAQEVKNDSNKNQATQQFKELVLNNQAELEAEVIGVTAYWYLKSHDTDYDPVLLSPLAPDINISLLDVWLHFFTSSKKVTWKGLNAVRFYTSNSVPRIEEHADGRPKLQSHPNWDSWVDAIDELYVEPILRTQ